MPKRFNEFIGEMRTRPLTKREKGKLFLKTPRQIPGPPGGHPVPPGYKRVHDVISGGTKLVKVDEPVSEGVLGAVIGGVAGGLAGGPLGAAAGAYAGHKILQRASQNKSMLDAVVASKMADVSDKMRARKAVAAGQTRFRPSAISRYLRNIAVRKSGGIYASSPDGTEPVTGFAKAAKKSNVVPFPKKTSVGQAPHPHQVQQAAAPAEPVTSVHPAFTDPQAHEREPGLAAAAKRKAAQAAIAARVRAQEKNPRPRSNTIIIP